MEFIAIRHAITDFNQLQLINGQVDEDISEAGRAQIPGLIEELGNYAFQVIYCSSLKRARSTAEPIAAHYNVPVIIDDRIIEVNFGTFAGQSWEATVPVFGLNSSGLLNTHAYDFRGFGGESADQTKKRVESFLEDLKHVDRPLVVTHGGILRWLYYFCSEERLAHVSNASVHKLKIGR